MMKVEEEVTGRNVGPLRELPILGFPRKWMGSKMCYLNIKGESQNPGNTQATDSRFMLTPQLSLCNIGRHQPKTLIQSHMTQTRQDP